MKKKKKDFIYSNNKEEQLKNEIVIKVINPDVKFPTVSKQSWTFCISN